MFWGLVLKANRKYTQTIKKGFHLSHAALDTTSCSDEIIQVMLTSDGHSYILCNLRKNKTEQVALDLNFAEGDEISFTSQGNGNVHLSGYLIPEDDLGLYGEEDDLESEDNETAKVIEKKPVHEKLKSKKAKQDEIEDSSDLDDSDEDEEEDDDDEDEEDGSSSEEEVEPKPKHAKLDSSNKQNGLDNGKVQSKEKQKEKKEKKQKQEKSPKGGEKTIQGGVKVEDIRVGNGPEAKAGKKVQVYYEGRLKSNNKVFDSSKQGAGFKFGLGRGEVIKGWDIGVAGMKVGGKRRITCPPNMAYGAKGSPPVIPPNSTLVFEVELKAVN